jgi:hypothetical protein
LPREAILRGRPSEPACQRQSATLLPVRLLASARELALSELMPGADACPRSLRCLSTITAITIHDHSDPGFR